MGDSKTFSMDVYVDKEVPGTFEVEETLDMMTMHLGTEVLWDYLKKDDANYCTDFFNDFQGLEDVLDAFYVSMDYRFPVMEEVMDHWCNSNRQEVILGCPHCPENRRVAVKLQSTWQDDRTGIRDAAEQPSQEQWYVICDARESGCGSSGGIKNSPEDAIGAWNVRS